MWRTSAALRNAVIRSQTAPPLIRQQRRFLAQIQQHPPKSTNGQNVRQVQPIASAHAVEIPLMPPSNHPHPDRLSIAVPDLQSRPDYQPPVPQFLVRLLPFCFERDPKPGYEEHGHAGGVLSAVGLLVGWMILGGLAIAHGYERYQTAQEKLRSEGGGDHGDLRKRYALYIQEQWHRYFTQETSNSGGIAEKQAQSSSLNTTEDSIPVVMK